jgi:hypothetical protein
MASFRIPRGYSVNVPQYRELMEGVRPESSATPMEAWTGLPPVQIEELHHDPVVIMPGTFVGIATGGTAAGKLFPAHGITGSNNMTGRFSSTDSTWGLLTSDATWAASTITAGPVLPLGVVYNPVYSFNLQEAFVNYKRNESVGVLTDYLIQIPAITTSERDIQVGEMVMVNPTANEYGRSASLASINNLMGRLAKWDGSASTLKYVVGRCFGKVGFADGTGATGTKLNADTTWSLTTAGKAEFKGLDKVQTVPGLGLAGSGTKGVPAWLQEATADSNGKYYALNILVRL